MQIRTLASDVAAMLRGPSIATVREIRCPACYRWVTPRRYDHRADACRRCAANTRAGSGGAQAPAVARLDVPQRRELPARQAA
ncbi:hypothetical protein [Rhizomonospora bruguierae]|uniref:hypothetical protein n=1 Tax=Rhizomonospora bruguierae TaxID=1581705 RepID=UPI001BCD58AB|nr:hypothetical protein [Micromonospora sp. NBRC 107566]